MSGPGMICSEDAMMLLVRRIEALAAKADGNSRLQAHNGSLVDTNGRLRKDVEQLRKDLDAAEAKVTEWAVYADTLIKIIAVGQASGKDKRKRIVLPIRPAPLECDIPF